MAQLFEHGYALLIGVDESQVREWALPDVQKDVASLAQVLVHPERCGYRPQHVRTVSGFAATRKGILEGFHWLQTQLSANKTGDATAVVFYSGHGWRDTAVAPPDYYFIPFDVEPQRLRATALPGKEFGAAVNGLAARRLLVVMDCCHAGGMGVKDLAALAEQFAPAPPPAAILAGSETMSKAVASDVLTAESSNLLRHGAGRAVLVSCANDQQSYIRRDRAMSIFTYHLIEALTGHAQPAGGSPEVLVSDLVSYVYRQVPQSTAQQYGQEQQPDATLSGNFAVALVLGGSGIKAGAAAPDPLAGAHTPGQNIVQGDQITVGNISGSVVAIGRGAQTKASDCESLC